MGERGGGPSAAEMGFKHKTAEDTFFGEEGALDEKSSIELMAKGMSVKELEEFDYRYGSNPKTALEIDSLIKKAQLREDGEKKEVAEKNETMIAELGSLLHNEWRASRKKEDGTFESRQKKTKDQDWILKNGSEEVDIANTDYENLPEDWKGENKLSAEVAIHDIQKAVNEKRALNKEFVESASDSLHIKWLERNGSWAPPEQNIPYNELSEEEKEKDRVIIRKAIQIFQASK